MGVSLDGFTAGPGDAIDWSVPSEELHRFHNEQAREVGLHLYGRKLYETMRFWDSLEPPEADVMLEFAEIYRATPKLVFSRTLSEVEGNATLATGDPVEEVRRLKQEPGADLAVGGPGLAAPLVAAGLVDEFRLFVSPVVLGAGTPFFPPLAERIELELLETRTFPDRAVYLRYGAL
jgi:dihydrofolate reductase